MSDERVDVREAVLTAARALLAEAGPSNLSLREVARRAGVSHQAPYHYWKTKQDLLDDIAGRGFHDLDRSMAEAQAIAAPTPREQLVAAGLGYWLFATKNPAEYKLMMNRDHVVVGRSPLLTAHATGAYARLLEAVRAVRGEAAGKDGNDLDAFDVGVDAHAHWALVHGLSWFSIEGTLRGMIADPLVHVRTILERSMAIY